MITVNREFSCLCTHVIIQKMNKNNGSKKSYSSWIAKINKVKVAKVTYISKPVTLEESLKAILIVGQLFGLIPVIGLYRKKEANVRFYWISWKCFYSIVLLIGQTFMCVMCLINIFRVETTLKSTSSAIFYATTCITMMMFLKVSSKWPMLVKHATQTEDLDPSFDARLTIKCYTTCVVILTLALESLVLYSRGMKRLTTLRSVFACSVCYQYLLYRPSMSDAVLMNNSRRGLQIDTSTMRIQLFAFWKVEHILSLVYAFSEAMECYPYTSTYEGFVRVFYPWVYNFIPYSTVPGLVTQFLHFQATFTWNFSDVFVICMSYYLTSRLNNVNQKLLMAQGKYLPASFWRTTREDYCRTTQLVRKIDENIGGIVFISFANNLFFVCLQLFNTLEDGIKGTEECRTGHHEGSSLFGGYEAPAYFIFSLVYLISRSVAVVLIASQVNSASAVPAPVLYDVPSPVYCIEVQRFIDQVNGENVALSGLQFFNVTRGLLLTVAGTIVTYELVMLQFTPPAQAVSPTLPNITIN